MRSHPSSRGRRRGGAAWLFASGLLLLLLLAVSAGAAENPLKLRPGARGKLCLECHADLEETLKLPHVHTPVKAGSCSDCHDPHASSHGTLLAEAPDRICSSCHEGIAGESPLSAHSAVVEGNCSLCHDPHASSHESNLVRGGSDLCAACHEEVVRGVGSAQFGHAPAREDCLSCHDPHASSTSASLLKQSEPELCLECHDASGAAFRDRHGRYPVDRGRCTSCHAPHGSSQGGMLRARVHRPVANGMCAQCHHDPGAPNALETRRSGPDLCRGCHSDVVNLAFAARHLHWPVADKKACLNCHSPHASSVAGLLTEPIGPLCGRCHADVIARGERSLTKHEPVADGDCLSCHAPHAADNFFLFEASSSTELCSTCHDWGRHSAHPIGEGVVDMRNPNLLVDCTSCHRTHGSPHKHLASFDVKADLCVDCHESFRR